MSERIFISSVQKELAEERRAIRDYVRSDALLRRFFTVFLFEDLPALDRRADDVYLDEIARSTLYVGLFGQQYGGSTNNEGLSPTEREFDQATALGKTRLIFVKGSDDSHRDPKMRALIAKAGVQLIRRRFTDSSDLKTRLYASLVDYLADRGVIQSRAFDERPCSGATLDDIDTEAVARFVGRARDERQFPLPERAPVADVLSHLNLLYESSPSNAALMLFGRDPQRFIPCAEVRCMHFHGTEVQRPAPSYQVFKGNLFDEVDRAADFVLAVLARSVGTRVRGPQAPVAYEIPPDVVREGVVNAIAHRDYASAAAVQVAVFADRVEISNPGMLPPPLTPARLHKPHNSILRNARLCEALFLTRYIEKFGTGTLMMIYESTRHALPEPDFEQRGGEFVVTIWRDWLTAKRLAGLELNSRQRLAIGFIKSHRRMANADYQKLAGTTKKTASRDLDDLVRKKLFTKVGRTGRGTHYVLATKGDKKGTKGTPDSPPVVRRQSS